MSSREAANVPRGNPLFPTPRAQTTAAAPVTQNYPTDQTLKPTTHDELDHSPVAAHHDAAHVLHHNPPLQHPTTAITTATRPLRASALPPAGRGHLTRGDRHFSTDDTGLTKQVTDTDASFHEDLDVKPILSIVEDILLRGQPLDTTLGTEATEVLKRTDPFEDKPFQSVYHDSEIVKLLAYPINKISCEIICKCSAGADAHSSTIGLLQTLSNYEWDAKVVISVAAFSVSYGEFWLVEHLHAKNPLAKDIAALKDLPETMTDREDMKKKLDAVVDLLKAVVSLTHIIIRFKELPSQLISRDSPEMKEAHAHIPTNVYWIIRSVLACASILLNLAGSSHEYAASESWEILSLAHKLKHMHEYLERQLLNCNEAIERTRMFNEFNALNKLFETSHIDNMKILSALILAKADQRPLFDGTRKINERLEVLRLKYTLLLISDLELPQEELNILHMIYNQQTMRHEYEVLWLPIVDKAKLMSPTEERQFVDLRNSMPWYSVDHPTLVNPVAIRYIREVWNFVHMPMLVVLDPQGRVSNLNALPVMWIWGSPAFPFTRQREMALWAESTWNIELLADSIDPRIPDWIKENRIICLYGGEDIDWIRRFTTLMRTISNTWQVPVEMLYVGKSNPKDKVRRCHEIIDREKLSHTFPVREYYDYVWFFWVRLGSMWNSKLQHGMTVENDPIMQEIMTMLTYDGSEQGWAVFSRGIYEMTRAKGDILIRVLEDHNRWGTRVDHADKFVPTLAEEISGVHPEHHCNRLILPGHGYIPERVVCSECGRTMDQFVMYRCCTD